MDMFDTIAASEKGAFLHLISPATGEPAYALGADGKEDKSRPIRIKLVGADSKEFRNNVRERSTKIIKKRAGKLDFAKMSEAQISAFLSEQEDSQIADAVDATIAWENVTAGNNPIEFTAENVTTIYERYPDILRQVHEFRINVANFFATATASSSSGQSSMPGSPVALEASSNQG